MRPNLAWQPFARLLKQLSMFNRSTKESLKRLLRRVFEVGQKTFRINILPHHFYSEVPNIAELKADDYWKQPNTMYGINGANTTEQLAFAQMCCPKELSDSLATLDVHMTAVKANGEDNGYGPIEADFLYSFIIAKQPKRVVQVGCGVSTAIILRAAADAGYTCEVICLEPYPMEFLKRLNSEGKITLVQEKAQKVATELMTNLSPGDLFFVDSTHTVKTGSEVNKLVLEVLPRMPKGVFVHFHDIYFPFDYGRHLMSRDLFFWTESTLLYSFLTNNPRYTIRVAMSMLHYDFPSEMQKLLPAYRPQPNDFGLAVHENGDFPCSIFLEVVA